MTLTPPEFAARWRAASLSERSGAQSHFIDLCEMLGYPHPAAADGVGERFTFEKPVSKVYGGYGFADVWLRDHFAWEYKESRNKKHKNLPAAYKQLNDYREELGNPPLLVVCDMNIFQVHTNFTATYKRVYEFGLDDLQKNQVTATCPIPPLDVLRALFDDYNVLRPERTDAQVTQDAARLFSRLAERLELEDRDLGASREQVAHFLMRLLFCLFADSIGLLPNHVFRNLVQQDRQSPKRFLRKLTLLFEAMSEPEGIFGEHSIKYFNGGLFDTASILPLDHADLGILYEVSRNYDWSHIAPAIFGTLFQRSLDPRRRSLVGAHYTSEEDILLVIEPVLLRPLRERWQAAKNRIIEALEVERARETIRNSRQVRRPCVKQSERLLGEWIEELTSIRVLDPACGSGNFLYVALRRMLDLWFEAQDFAAEQRISLVLPKMVSPQQLFGIELEFYAHELASIVVWIGFLQWKHEHAVHDDRQPVLQKLTNIEHGDAILRDDGGNPSEPEWPYADFIIGNPPFLGDKFMRRELGDKYVEDLRRLYAGRVPGGADLVTFWFEKARHQIQTGQAMRAGLLATNSIRMVGNRFVLARIRETGGIFWAQSDRPWMLEGAAVRVSMIGFDNGSQVDKMLDGDLVTDIYADLTSGSDLVGSSALKENAGLCFLGIMKGGPFEISADQARKFLSAPSNVNGKTNRDVIRRRLTGRDIVQRNQNSWIIDFREMPERQAAMYEWPFEFVRKVVKPVRDASRDRFMHENWWAHGRSRPALRKALRTLGRCIVTPEVAKHRIFAWMDTEVVPDHTCHVIAREDDYFFGILQSSVHVLWVLQTGSTLEDRPRYNSQTTFETFPFPWAPGNEPSQEESPVVKAIANAARELVRLRDVWLNPQGVEAAVKSRTLTSLYNERPIWLENAHRDLDVAVFGAYGWKYPLERNEILRRLLALNRERTNKPSVITKPELPPKKAPAVERLPGRKPTERVVGSA